MKLPKQEKNKNSRRKRNVKILKKIGSTHNQTSGDEIKKIKKRVSQENEKNTRNQIKLKEANKRYKYLGCPLVRYSKPLLKWTRHEFKQIDQRTWKLMTMHEALHPRDDVDRLYVSRKEEEIGLASIEDSVDVSIQWLEGYIEKHGGRLITATRNNSDDTRVNRTKLTRKQK